ncbi:MAG: MBL fold metallo-hydrolase, partial [Burkholderiales bacterium]
MRADAGAAPADIHVLERGWLSSNNVLLHGAPGEGATLIDSGHVTHAPQTVALVAQALQGEPLARIVNTHLHSDHCGGNASLQRAHPKAQIWIPPGQADAVARWDEQALTYTPTGQLCERFQADGLLRPGDVLRTGQRHWQALAAPGHDPHSLILFDAQDGVLISADALWGNGFGVVFPELEGAQAFDEVAAVLDLIDTLPVRWVIPGHGAPFGDVAAALQRARSRLTSFRSEPVRHARFAGKSLLVYHLMETGPQPWAAIEAWLASATLMPLIHSRSGQGGASLPWFETLTQELVDQGALQ